MKQKESKAGASNIRSCKKPKLSEEEAIKALQIEENRSLRKKITVSLSVLTQKHNFY